MEVKVWVEGLPKTICGISSATTTQDVVYALAHATGKRGRFVLFERWGKSEKPLAPGERLWTLLEQKGEFRHDVQFILRKTDTSGSQSRASDSSSPLPDLSPFQRGQNNHSAGNLRKTLTTHGLDWIPPKIIKNRSSGNAKINDAILSTSHIPSPIKENNFPGDLIGMHYKPKENSKESVPGNADLVANIPSRTAVDTRKVISPKNVPAANPLFIPTVPSANGSLDVHLRGSVPDMGNNVSFVHRPGLFQKEPPERDERRSQLLAEIRQQDELLSNAKTECAYYDRELALWEQRTIKLTLEASEMENQVKLMQDAEKVVLSELDELSSSSLEQMIKSVGEAQVKVKSDLIDYKSKIGTSESAIGKAKNEMRILHEQLQVERNEYEKQKGNAEAEIKEERELLIREIQELIALQDSQNKALDDLALNDQRMESTLLAKQLELDSLQNILTQSDVDSFLEFFAVHTPLEPAGGPAGKPVAASVPVVDQRSSPAPPVRKSSVAAQRILVLKRNVARDPQGMWV